MLLQLRLWLRRGSTAEKRAALGACLLAGALAAWALIPTGGDGSGGATSFAGGATAAAPAATTDSSVAAPTAGQTTSAPAVAGGGGATVIGSGTATSPSVAAATTGQAATAAPACPAGSTDQGVTATSIHIGVGTVQIAGQVGNAAFKIRPDQEQIINAIVDDINKNGGIKCRKVEVSFYEENPLDQSAQHDTCLKMVQDKLFAVIDGGGFVPSSNSDCVAQNKIPIFVPRALDPPETTTYTPYVFGWYNTSVAAVRNAAYGARDLGLLDPANGFKKAGLLEESCFPPVVYKELEKDLADVGVSGDKLDKVVLQCGSGDTPPSAADITAAVIHNKQAGSNVMFAAIDPIALDSYTQVAEQQRYRPKYASGDFIDQIGAEGNVNASNFDGAIGYTASRTGSKNAGLPFDKGTARCDQVAKSHGLRGYEDEKSDSILGAYCSSIWLFVAAASHGTSLTRAALAANLAQAGTVELAAPAADAKFGAAGKTWGGDFIRPVQWHADCQCWKAMRPEWRGPF